MGWDEWREETVIQPPQSPCLNADTVPTPGLQLGKQRNQLHDFALVTATAAFLAVYRETQGKEALQLGN